MATTKTTTPNYTQLAKELRKHIGDSIYGHIVEVSKTDEEEDGLWVTAKDSDSIGRVIEIADFCRYHDLNVYVTQRCDHTNNYKRITAVRIF